jgi:hypothetical protein
LSVADNDSFASVNLDSSDDSCFTDSKYGGIIPTGVGSEEELEELLDNVLGESSVSSVNNCLRISSLQSTKIPLLLPFVLVLRGLQNMEFI